MVTRVEASRQRYTHKIAWREHPIRVTADQLIMKERKKTDVLTGQLAADDSFVPLPPFCSFNNLWKMSRSNTAAVWSVFWSFSSKLVQKLVQRPHSKLMSHPISSQRTKVEPSSILHLPYSCHKSICTCTAASSQHWARGLQLSRSVWSHRELRRTILPVTRRTGLKSPSRGTHCCLYLKH